MGSARGQGRQHPGLPRGRPAVLGGAVPGARVRHRAGIRRGRGHSPARPAAGRPRDAAPLGARAHGWLGGTARGDLGAGPAPATPHGTADHRGGRSAGASAVGRAGGAQCAPGRGHGGVAGTGRGWRARADQYHGFVPVSHAQTRRYSDARAGRGARAAARPGWRGPALRSAAGYAARSDHQQRQLLHRDQERRGRSGACIPTIGGWWSTARCSGRSSWTTRRCGGCRASRSPRHSNASAISSPSVSWRPSGAT